MLRIELVIKGTKGNVIIKGSTFEEVLAEYEMSKGKIERVLGNITVSKPTQKTIVLGAATIQGRITMLNEKGFFKSPKTARQVRNELRVLGYPYSLDRVSIGLIRLVRKRQLRRLMEKMEGTGVYVYVNP